MSVYLVGAGPGDPGLLTLKGQELLESADVVVYDHLANDILLELVRPGTEVVYVGKTPGRHALAQDAVNALLVERGKQGKKVVRLKGGDPFVFGRGGEEALALSEAGVEFEVVPGVTSAIAAAAYAGIPVTMRGVASSVCIITGHDAISGEGAAHNWEALSKGPDTLVVLMGLATLDVVCGNLVRAGMAPDRPAALVHWGTTPRHRVLVSTVDRIGQEAKEAAFTAPSALIIGDVVRMREKLGWFEKKPLLGMGVVVTRTREQARETRSRLEALGAQVFSFPTIAVAPMPDDPLKAAVGHLSSYDWVIFTSENGVECFFAVLADMNLDARAFASTKIAAMGPRTAQALRARGLLADFVPEKYVAESMVEGLAKKGLEGKRVLIARARVARQVLPERLVEAGAIVTALPIYETLPVFDDTRDLLDHLEAGDVHCVTFMSSSAVRNFFERIPPDVMRRFPDVWFACIGPVTAATLAGYGFKSAVEPEEYTIPALVAAIAAHRGASR